MSATTRLAVSTIGHPERDPDTGLVPEEHAYDYDAGDDPEQAFGDGRSIVGIGADVSLLGSIRTWCWVRPTYDQAPPDSGGRPMNHYLAVGDDAYHHDVDVDAAIAWFVARGITETYARKVVSGATAAHASAAAARLRRDRLDATADGLLAGKVRARDLVKILDLLGDMRADAALTAAFEQLTADVAGLGGADIAHVRRRVEQIAADENRDRYRRR